MKTKLRLAVAVLLAALPAAAQVVTVVDIIPNSMSNETNRDSEPNVAVDPSNPQHIAASAFTPDPGNSGVGPVFVSTDGGVTWDVRTMLPGGNRTFDTTIRFGGISGVLYGGIIRFDNSDTDFLRKADFTLNGAATILTSRSSDDQPWTEAATFMSGAAPDRIYVGSNSSFNPADVDQSLDVATAAAPAGMSTVNVDSGAGCRDAPSVRPAIHGSGRVYVAMLRFSACAASTATGDVIVMRDDDWASTAPRYQALMTGPSPGVAVVSGRTFPFVNVGASQLLGTQRVGSSIAIAVDPTNRDIVYVAWGEGATGSAQSLHLRRSTNGGSLWSSDLRVISNATNPALAVNSQGVAAFLYQKNTGGATPKWETHVEYSTNGFTSGQTDLVLASAPDQLGSYVGPNPIGDYTNLVAAGKSFYGVFCAFNTADQANFPQGITYLRNHDFVTKKLRNLANTADVAESIDPYFFRLRMLAPEKDFYVRDWNDGTTGDDGTEPSTHPVFYATGDVWNRRGTLPGVFGDNDPPLNEDAGNGAGNIGDNWAFARIRRNASTGAATVNVHFLVSEFGTGSGFSDDTTMNPDITFDPDTTVNFATGELGPKITNASHWTLASTASTHLCLAVQIGTADDPFVPPSLANEWPGWSSGTDLRILADNNKAQKNMGLSVMPARGVGFSDLYYAIVHNAASFTRDMELSWKIDPVALRALGATLSAAGDQETRKLGPSGSMVLRGMKPGDSRWVAVRFNSANLQPGELQMMNFFELVSGVPVNGFTIAARGASAEEALGQKVALHRSVFTRLAALGVAGADEEVKWAAEALDRHISVQGYVAVLQRPALIETIAGLAKKGLRIGPFDPSFDLAGLLSTFQKEVATKDPARCILAHSALLNALDAAITNVRLAGGNPADIVTTIAWQRDLYGSNGRLAKVPCAAGAVKTSAEYVEAIGRRKITNAVYPEFLRASTPCFAETASLLGSEQLKSAAEAVRLAGDNLAAAQKAHRSYLILLDQALR